MCDLYICEYGYNGPCPFVEADRKRLEASEAAEQEQGDEPVSFERCDRCGTIR